MARKTKTSRPVENPSQQIRKSTIAHGVESRGAQRAIDIAAKIEQVKASLKAAGAKQVECIFGEQGTLTVFEWL